MISPPDCYFEKMQDERLRMLKHRLTRFGQEKVRLAKLELWYPSQKTSVFLDKPQKPSNCYIAGNVPTSRAFDSFAGSRELMPIGNSPIIGVKPP